MYPVWSDIGTSNASGGIRRTRLQRRISRRIEMGTEFNRDTKAREAASGEHVRETG